MCVYCYSSGELYLKIHNIPLNKHKGNFISKHEAVLLTAWTFTLRLTLRECFPRLTDSQPDSCN